MSIDDKKKALKDAGVKVRSNASDETIEELYDGYVAEFGPIDDRAEEADARAELETSEVSSFENPPAVKEDMQIRDESGKSIGIRGTTGPIGVRGVSGSDAFTAFLLTNQHPQMGDKTPAVIEWARENLSAEEFKARYKGRVLPV